MHAKDPVPGWSVPPTAAPRRRTGLIAGVIGAVAVLLVAVGVTTALALRPGSSTVHAEPAASASGAVALGAESSADPGRAAAGQPAAPSGKPSAVPPPSASPPSSRAPVTPAPAPTTNAPVAKPPATEAPAKKAPEIDKAVAKSGARGAGPCSPKLAAGYACLQTYGDIWWVYDTKADSHSAVVFWQVGDRSGQCANSMGNGKVGACNKNYPEGASGRAKVCIMDWDTKQVHQCTAYFSFTTG